jgi:hypothetical protein
MQIFTGVVLQRKPGALPTLRPLHRVGVVLQRKPGIEYVPVAPARHRVRNGRGGIT